MNVRKWCACGCGRSVADRRRGTKWATPTCRSSARAREKLVQGGTGGAQVSYRKAVEAAARATLVARGFLPGLVADQALRAEMDLVRPYVLEALPARQRARLEARSK